MSHDAKGPDYKPSLIFQVSKMIIYLVVAGVILLIKILYLVK